jgi:prepilin signal peptidase PulO-like enzyme (type II secretory pathway)
MSVIGAILLAMGFDYYWIMKERDLEQSLSIKMSKSIIFIILSVITHYLCLTKYGYQSNYYAYFVMTLMLMVVALMDIKTLKVPMDLVILMGGIGAVGIVVLPTDERLLRIVYVIGAFMLMKMLYHLLRGGIGDGDVYIIVLIVLYLGWAHALLVFILALVISGVIGGIMMLMGKATRKSVLPFVPFIAIVQLGLLLV